MEAVSVLLLPMVLEAMDKIRLVTRGVKTEYPASSEMTFLPSMLMG